MAMRPALLAGLYLLAAAPAAGAPRVDDFSVPVNDGLKARAASAVVEPGRRFDLVGLRWHGAGKLEGARLRTRAHGRWRRWIPMPDADGGRHGLDPVWVDGADA